MPTRGSPLAHSPFTALGSVGFASARFSSVLFCLLAIWLWGGACCVRLCCHCCCCHRLWLGIVCFAIISTHATTASTCYCYLLLLPLLLFLRTMEICMFPITALKSQPNSHNNNCGTIESCLLLMITIIIIIVVLYDGPQSVSRVPMPLLLLPSPVNAVLQCIENENTHGYTLSTKQKACKKHKTNAFFHLQNAHILTHTHMQRCTSILVYFLYCTLNTWETVTMLFCLFV